MDNSISPAERVFVCGAGHQGLSMAAHLALNGLDVTLWNRTEEHIREVMTSGVIRCNGVVRGEARLRHASADMAEVFADFVMVTTPSTAHRDVAGYLAPFVGPDTVIVLNPGRTFGAIDFADALQDAGVATLPRIAETQTIVYTCRKSGAASVTIYALKHDVQIAALKRSDIDYIMRRMPTCLKPYFIPVSSVALTSFSNVGMILHCAPVLMNIGWIECEKVEFKYYYDGISPSVARYLEKMDAERLAVAGACGYKVESVQKWLQRTYQVEGNTLYECIRHNDAYAKIDAPPALNTRYIFEDVPNGLVPIEAAGREKGVSTPHISTIIDLACTVTDTDFRRLGRRFAAARLETYF